jgi:hypothetical protein
MTLLRHSASAKTSLARNNGYCDKSDFVWVHNAVASSPI